MILQKIKNNRHSILIALFIFGVTLLIFGQFFFNSLHPYPGNYMLAWYEPWKSDHMTNGVITLTHKAVIDDSFRQLYPFRMLAAEIIKQYNFPLWNPYNGSGMPLMATMHPGFFNPFNILFLILPGHFAWSWYIILQVPLLCLGMYLYSRSIYLSLRAAIFTTSIFLFCSFVVVRLLFGEYIYVLSALPIILFLIEKSLQKPKFVLFIPLVVYFMFVSGQPQMILYVLLLSSAYAVYRCHQEKKRKNIYSVFIMMIIGIGLAGFQLLPTIELFQNASINTESSKFIFEKFLLPLNNLIGIIIPNYFGNQATYNYWGHVDYIETAGAVGTIPFLFALFWYGKRTLDVRKFYVATTIITVLTAIDWQGSRLLFSLPIPIISTGIPSRVFVLTSFSIAILAGYGFDAWLKSRSLPRSSLYQIATFCAMVISIVLVTAYLYINNTSCNNQSEISCRLVALRNTLFEFFIFISAVLLLIISLKFQKIKQVIAVGFILIIVLVGNYNAQKFLPFSPTQSFNPSNELITYLQTKTTDGRIFGFDEASIKTDFATNFRFFEPNYYDPLYNKRYGELVNFANTGIFPPQLLRSDVTITEEATVSADVAQRRNRLFDLLHIKYLIYKKSQNPQKNTAWENDNFVVIKNDNVLEHTYILDTVTVEPDSKKSLQELFSQSFNPRQKVIVEKNPDDFKHDTNTKLVGKAKIIDYKENSVTIQVTSNKNALLILSDNYYPGWKAVINDRETKIFRANYTFRGVAIPAGKHTVVFSYQPFSLKLGIFISLTCGAIYLLSIIYWIRRPT